MEGFRESITEGASRRGLHGGGIAAALRKDRAGQAGAGTGLWLQARSHVMSQILIPNKTCSEQNQHTAASS